jgi:hypothetical protein
MATMRTLAMLLFTTSQAKLKKAKTVLPERDWRDGQRARDFFVYQRTPSSRPPPMAYTWTKGEVVSIKEAFYTFAARGNVIDLTVAVIIGGAFQAVINSFVKDIM